MTDQRSFLLAGLLLAILAFAPRPNLPDFIPGPAEISGDILDATSQQAEPQERFLEGAVGEILPPITLPAPTVLSETAHPVRISDVPDIVLDASAALVVTHRGEVLFDKNSTEALSIASISKLMTALVALESLSLDALVPVSSNAIRTDGDSAKLLSGETLSLHDMLLAMLVPSSNDAAVAIAEALGGTSKLVEAMNATAALMDLQTAQFTNPHGLTPPGNSASARDVARLLQEAMLDPTIAEMLKQKDARAINTQGILHEWDSTNILFDRLSGIVAGKTGYTTESKGTLAIAFAPKAALERRAAQPQDEVVLVVVLGSDDRFTDTESLARWAMGAYQW